MITPARYDFGDTEKKCSVSFLSNDIISIIYVFFFILGGSKKRGISHMVLLHYRFTDLRLLLMHPCGFHAETVPANPRKTKKRFRDCSRFASICKEIRARKMSRPLIAISQQEYLRISMRRFIHCHIFFIPAWTRTSEKKIGRKKPSEILNVFKIDCIECL